MPTPQPDETVTFAASPDSATVAFVASPGSATVTLPGRLSFGRGFDEEVRRLLRSRLIFVHLLALLYISLLAALSWAVPNRDPLMRPDQGNPWRLLPPFAEYVVGIAVLWRSPGMTLRALRLWELAGGFEMLVVDVAMDDDWEAS